MGPDQRISANANIYDDPETTTNEVANPHWVGVWDSWIAGDPVLAEVNDAYPSAASHHQTIGSKPDVEMRPDYANKDEHFRRWLVSLDPSNAATLADTATNLNLNGEDIPVANSTAVRLVGENTTNSTNSNDYANASLIDVRDGSSSITGRYGWWVGDESQKARIMDDPYLTDTTPLVDAQRIQRSQAPGSMGNEAVNELANLSDEGKQQLAFIPSRQSMDLLDGVSSTSNGRPSSKFHDLTTHSIGVISDVREGGLKRDLSMLLERPIDITEDGDEFMLYKFDTKDEWAHDTVAPVPDTPQEAVPIQDLAAYYQLYDNDPNGDRDRKDGLRYSGLAGNNLQAYMPDLSLIHI